MYYRTAGNDEPIVEEEEETEESDLVRRAREWASHEFTQFCAQNCAKDLDACRVALFGAANASSDPVVRGLANRYEILSKTLKLLRAES